MTSLRDMTQDGACKALNHDYFRANRMSRVVPLLTFSVHLFVLLEVTSLHLLQATGCPNQDAT
jgi:hypothetical protein